MHWEKHKIKSCPKDESRGWQYIGIPALRRTMSSRLACTTKSSRLAWAILQGLISNDKQANKQKKKWAMGKGRKPDMTKWEKGKETSEPPDSSCSHWLSTFSTGTNRPSSHSVKILKSMSFAPLTDEAHNTTKIRRPLPSYICAKRQTPKPMASNTADCLPNMNSIYSEGTKSSRLWRNWVHKECSPNIKSEMFSRNMEHWPEGWGFVFLFSNIVFYLLFITDINILNLIQNN